MEVERSSKMRSNKGDAQEKVDKSWKSVAYVSSGDREHVVATTEAKEKEYAFVLGVSYGSVETVT